MLHTPASSEVNNSRPERPSKKPRKSRGKGLRVTTGCLTCRARHKKCDEQKPNCGPCAIGEGRVCEWPQGNEPRRSSRHLAQPQSNGNDGPVNQATEPATSVSPGVVSHASQARDATDSDLYAMQPRQPPSHMAAADAVGMADTEMGLPGRPLPVNYSQDAVSPELRQVTADHERLTGRPHDTLAVNCSPDTVSSELWTIDSAPNRWLGMLANDSGFTTSPARSPADASDHFGRTPVVSSVHATAQAVPATSQPLRTDDSAAFDVERRKWQADGDVVLTNHEASLLRHFADRCARWLDLFDSQKLFSTYAVRLALRNPGLMKAILALAAKHRSRSQGLTVGFDNTGAVIANALEDSEDNEWIRYYSETLRYVAVALVYESYKASEELLVTAIVVSAYEMLDESDGSGDWQRHLKGVFWIQRSQDVNGTTGGIRQATWWAWLRQDLWAAFREKRACLSFWKPVKDVRELDQHELADWAIYLLSQAVNYSSQPRRVEPTSAIDSTASLKRKPARDELLAKMERWKSCLGDEYKPLPTSASPTDVFTPLWVHPPKFGVALQAYSFAQILITLHSPSLAGFNDYRRMQRTLAEAVETICGIAMELKEEGCQILSAQCLYAAGLCVHDPSQRRVIITLMQACESRLGWPPIVTWMDDLRLEWAKADGESVQP